MQKSVVFVYTNNELSGKEVRKTIPFITASKTIQYSGINLIKEAKDLYIDNFRTLLRDTDKETNIWKDILCPWIKKYNIVKMSILPKTMDRFNPIPNKISMAFFTDIGKYILKSVWNHKRS